MVRKSTACYLGRFDIANVTSVTALSVTDSAPDSISLRQSTLLDNAATKLVGPRALYTMRDDLFNNVYGIYGRIKQSPLIGITEAECAARCSLQCDVKSSNEKCNYYLYNKKVCYFGNFGVEQDEIDIVTANGYVIELPCDKLYLKNSPTLDIKGLLPTGSGTCTSASTTIDVTSSSFSQTLSLSSTTSGTVSCQYVAHRSLTGGRLRLSLSAVSVNTGCPNKFGIGCEQSEHRLQKKSLYFAPKNCFLSLFCELQEMKLDFLATFLQFQTIY